MTVPLIYQCSREAPLWGALIGELLSTSVSEVCNSWHDSMKTSDNMELDQKQPVLSMETYTIWQQHRRVPPNAQILICHPSLDTVCADVSAVSNMSICVTCENQSWPYCCKSSELWNMEWSARAVFQHLSRLLYFVGTVLEHSAFASTRKTFRGPNFGKSEQREIHEISHCA